jgi:hypothetical protein
MNFADLQAIARAADDSPKTATAESAARRQMPIHATATYGTRVVGEVLSEAASAAGVKTKVIAPEKPPESTWSRLVSWIKSFPFFRKRS